MQFFDGIFDKNCLQESFVWLTQEFGKQNIFGGIRSYLKRDHKRRVLKGKYKRYEAKTTLYGCYKKRQRHMDADAIVWSKKKEWKNKENKILLCSKIFN